MYNLMHRFSREQAGLIFREHQRVLEKLESMGATLEEDTPVLLAAFQALVDYSVGL